MPQTESYGVPEFSAETEALVASEKDLDARLGRVEVVLQKLMRNRRFVGEFLSATLTRKQFPSDLMRTVDQHDFTICRSPSGSFSLKLYVWLPGAHHPIHDHGSWGVFGAYENELTVVRFHRMDDDQVEDRATLREGERFTLKPGQTTRILPFNEGIHWTGNDTDSMGLTVHVYGKAMRRGYILGFDDKRNVAYRIGTPRLERTLLAVKALELVGGEAARKALRDNLSSPYAPVRWQCYAGLAKLEGDSLTRLMEEALSDEDEGVRKKARGFLDCVSSPVEREG
ncbi:MAG: hypothetical protein Q7T04_05875 [Dehalococcoidia bacterium]|nr:hypothetical protein [Dehalococcoidia bacterium]